MDRRLKTLPTWPCQIAVIAFVMIVVVFAQPVTLRGQPTLPPPEVPATSPADKVIALPGPAADVVLAADGKYVLLPIPRLRVIAVVDVVAGAVASYLAIDSDNFEVAGGATKAVVVLTDKRTVQRWNLATGAMEASVPLNVDPGPVAMGMNSEGPVLIGRNFLDLKSLKRLQIAVSTVSPSGNQRTGGFGGFNVSKARARPDGKVFAANSAIMLIRGNEALITNDDPSRINAMPTPDVGGWFPAAVTAGPGRFLWPLESAQGETRAPTAHPDYVFTYRLDERTRPGMLGSGSDESRWYELKGAVHGAKHGDGKKRFDLPAVPEMSFVGRPAENVISLERRLIVDVANGRLLTVPSSCDQVFIRAIPKGDK